MFAHKTDRGGEPSSTPAPRQPQAAARSAPSSAPPSVQGGLQSSAVPLGGAEKQFFESKFDHDFSGVQVHAGPAAARSAQALQAQAYTVGQHIVMGASRSTDTGGGWRLLAHELAHVVQQDRGNRTGAAHSDAAALEAEADHAAASLDRGGGPVRIKRSGTIGVARQVVPPPAPPAQLAKLLHPEDIVKLRAFGESDYQASLQALQDILSKTKGFTQAGSPQQYVDIRQSAGELRAFLDYIRNPAIEAVKVVPSQMGDRTPDLYLRRVGGEEFRGEVVNVTQASRDVRPDIGVDKKGRQVPRIPKVENEIPGAQPTVELPTNKFKLGQIKTAISAKITPKGAGGSTQLDAQNLSTHAGGKPMATGGDVIVEVLDGSASKAELDKIVADLLPKLKPSAAKRVMISIIDSADPGAGRKVFEYVRGEGDVFIGSARTSFYRPGAAGVASPSGAGQPAPAAPQANAALPAGEPLAIEGSPAAKPAEPVKPSEALKPSEAVKPAEGSGAAAEAATAGKSKLRIGNGPKGRLAINLGMMAGLMVLDMLNRAQMAKAESERAIKWIEQTTGSPATMASVGTLVQQQRLSIARRQLNGGTSFATLSMKLAFTNDILDTAVLRDIKITDDDQSQFTSSVMSHDGLGIAEGKVWYVHASLPLDQIELSEVERAQLNLEKHDADSAAVSTLDPEALTALGETRQKLQAGLDEAKRKETDAKREAIGHSTVIADPGKRAQQQSEIAEELRQEAAKHPAPVPAPQPQPPSPAGPSLLPQAPAKGLELIPGANNARGLVSPAPKVAQSRAWSEKLEAAGLALRDRLGGNNRPSQQEIGAFLAEEHMWRLQTKAWMNYYHDHSQPEGVNGLGALLDARVPTLQQLRSQLGGD